MIGLALVTVVATLGAGLRGSTETAVKKQVKADFVVTAKDGGGSFTAASDAVFARRRRQGHLGLRHDRHGRPATSRPSAASTQRRSTTSTPTNGQRLGRARRRRCARDQGLRGPARPRRSAARSWCSPRADRSSNCAWSGSTSRRRWTRCSATSHRPEGVRRRLRPAAERVYVRRRQLQGGARQGDGGYPDAKLTPRRSSSRAAPTG